MKKSVFYSFLMAFAMIFSCAMVASCGDDDPDPAPKTTSGTIYYVEGYSPSIFDWVNVQTSVTTSDAEKDYVTVNKDNLIALSDISLPKSAKDQFDLSCKLAQIQSTNICRVTTISVTSPVTVTYVAHRQFSLKEGYVPTEKQSFESWHTFCFVGSDGSCFVTNFSKTYLEGLKPEKQASYLELISKETYDRKISLKDNNGSIEVVKD